MLSGHLLQKELMYCRVPNEILNDPELGVCKFFAGKDINDVRSQYEKLRETTLTESYGILPAADKWRLVEFLRRMEALIEANYILLKNKEKESQDRTEEQKAIEQALSNPALPDIDKIVAIIKAVSHPAKIFTIKSCADKDNPRNSKYDFLVLLDMPHETYVAMERRIDAACINLGSVLVTFRKESEAVTGLKDGHMLYSTICTWENLVYQKTPGPLPYSKQINILPITDQAQIRFRAEFKKAQCFLTSARQCHTNGDDPNMCAFMLHQAIEQASRAAVISYMDYWIFGHNLYLQLRHLHLLSETLPLILSNGSQAENVLISLLNRAYTEARYTDKQTITQDQVAILLSRVSNFQTAIEQVFEERLQHYRQKFRKA